MENPEERDEEVNEDQVEEEMLAESEEGPQNEYNFESSVPQNQEMEISEEEWQQWEALFDKIMNDIADRIGPETFAELFPGETLQATKDILHKVIPHYEPRAAGLASAVIMHILLGNTAREAVANEAEHKGADIQIALNKVQAELEKKGIQVDLKFIDMKEEVGEKHGVDVQQTSWIRPV